MSRIPVVQILLPAVVLFGVQGARAQSTDVQAVNAANTAFYAALSARDATAMSKVYAHDDFVMVVSPNGRGGYPPRNRSDSSWLMPSGVGDRPPAN
jgi:hypothetical protein